MSPLYHRAVRPLGLGVALLVLVWMSFGTGARAVTVSTSFGTSYQVNVDTSGRNITGDAANEPSLCIDPTNPNRIAIGWRQFNTTNSNFRQAGYGFSTNGGVNWTFGGTLETMCFAVIRSWPPMRQDAFTT